MKSISIVTPCYNEESNILEVYEQVKLVFSKLDNFTYEHIFIDNASKDHTVSILKTLAKSDKKIKIIINSRNFGHLRSPFYGLLQAQGDAIIPLVADLQDPPQLIFEFIKKWEEGYKIVVGVKPKSQERFPMSWIRKWGYHFISKISEVTLIKNFTGFGLYDKSVIKILRTIEDPYPYFRGLISEIGFPIAQITYVQPLRKHGFTKNNFFTLCDVGILGVISHSKVPIRLATLAGFFLSALSLGIAGGFLILKFLFWNKYPVGIAPILMGMFFFASVQLFFIGLLGEYVLCIHTQVRKRPLVIESERINF